VDGRAGTKLHGRVLERCGNVVMGCAVKEGVMVPKGWQKVRLGNIAKKVTSGSRGWAQYYATSGSKFIRMTNLSRDGIHLLLDDLRYVRVPSNSSDGKRTALEAGDILISITAELGKIGLTPEDFGKAFINQHIALVRVDLHKANSMFVAYLLSSYPMNRVINTLNDSGAKAGLNLLTIRSIPLCLPPQPEQKKIAQILSTWDKAIITTEKLIEVARRQRKALMQQLLTGKKRLLSDDGVRFSGEWEIMHLSDIAIITKGKALSSKDLVDGEYPVIAGGKASPYTHSSFTHENIITVSASGAYAGYVSYHPYKIWASDCSVVETKKNSDTKYVFYLLSHWQNKIYSLQSGGAQPHIYPKDLETLRVRIPSFSEQQKIAAVLSAADREIEVLQQKVDFLKQEKKALMQQLLTGKRRVKVQ